MLTLSLVENLSTMKCSNGPTTNLSLKVLIETPFATRAQEKSLFFAIFLHNTNRYGSLSHLNI